MEKIIAIQHEAHAALLKAKSEYIAVEGRNINFSNLIIKLCEVAAKK